jgi:hypothetical protein
VRCFIEFFAATICSKNARRAYLARQDLPESYAPSSRALPPTTLLWATPLPAGQLRRVSKLDVGDVLMV